MIPLPLPPRCWDCKHVLAHLALFLWPRLVKRVPGARTHISLFYDFSRAGRCSSLQENACLAFAYFQHHIKPDVMAGVNNPSTQEVDEGGSEFQDHPQLCSKSEISQGCMRTCLRKEKKHISFFISCKLAYLMLFYLKILNSLFLTLH